jgi:carbonic anhydrase
MTVERIEQLLANNQAFVAEQLRHDPRHFARLAQGQHPQFLWIGCSDSRVPPNLITGADEGDLFVHRNVANLVVQTDVNLLSVLQYAVDVLKVQHVIVCGHYGCGGVHAAMGAQRHGLIDHWLRALKDTHEHYADNALQGLDGDARFRRLVELNVVEQVSNLGKTVTVQDAWARGQPLWLHGWVYELDSGRILPQTSMIDGDAALHEVCRFERRRRLLEAAR